MAQFKEALQITLKYEGGHSKDPADPGGETYRGISRVHFQEWAGWKLLDSTTATGQELNAAVEQFYRDWFWKRLFLDDVKDQRVANVMFDCAVNCGQRVATALMQRTLNALNSRGLRWADIAEDGVMGPRTVGVLNLAAQARLTELMAIYTAERIHRYVELCEKNESLERFISGWVRRSIDVQLAKPVPST